jgi:hypothetical protein
VISVSDQTLRRLAWALWWFFLALVAVDLPLALTENSRSAESWGGVQGSAADVAFVVMVLAFPLTGLLILRRLPRNTIGWLLQTVGLVWGLGALAHNYARYGLVEDPGSLPGADVVAALNEGIWAPGIGLMGTFLILLFPDGHLPSRAWRPVAWLCAVTIVLLPVAVALSPGRLEESPVPTLANPLAQEWAAPVLEVALGVLLPLFALCIVACAVGLVSRFRHSRGIEREQLKWLATAGAAVATVFLVTIISTILTPATSPTPGWVTVLQTVSTPAFVLLPVAIGVAILQHRLYDVDVVINRALVYGSLTAALAAVYLASVLLLQLVLEPVTSQSDLAVAGSTLAVAALFRPARARIQAGVDRRFYRSRYDASLTLDAFVDQLRHQVDLDAVGDDLRTAVRETVQPVHLSLWLRQ